MNKNFINKILVGIFILIVAIPLLVSAQTGNHFGEQKFITYSIEYLDPLGVTVVDETGITYIPFQYGESHNDTILPERYFGSYSLYFAGGTLNFKAIIKNNGPRTYQNLKIETFQEFLNIEGGPGEGMGNDNKSIWFIEKLGPEEEVLLWGEFIIPLIGESGIDQTHLRISHWGPKDRKEKFPDQFMKGQILLEDFQAGLWCPMEILR